MALQAIEKTDDLVLLMLGAPFFGIANRSLQPLSTLVHRLKEIIGQRITQCLILVLRLKKTKVDPLCIVHIGE